MPSVVNLVLKLVCFKVFILTFNAILVFGSCIYKELTVGLGFGDRFRVRKKLIDRVFNLQNNYIRYKNII